MADHLDGAGRCAAHDAHTRSRASRFRAADPLEADWRDADSHGILLRTRTDQTSAHLDVPSFLADADERDSGEW
jgi:hypothetical protein